MGDLNCDTIKCPPEAHTRRLQFLSSLYQYRQLINEPTRVTRTSATLIDLILTNKEENISKSGVIHLGISDHSLVFAVRKYCVTKSRQKTRYARNFKRFNANNFLNDLSQMPWEKNLMRVRDSYKKMAVKNNSQIYWEKFKETRNKVNSELTKAKTAFFCNKFENCAQSKDMKHSWKLINILLGKNKKSNNISQLKRDDVVISDDTLKAEAFNDFFVNIGVNLANEMEHDSPCTNFSDDENYHSNYYSNINFKFSEISMDDIICQLRNLKISKSTGIDNIPAIALKLSAEVIGPSLTWIYNLSIKTGIYVDEWKKAWVIPIFKSDDRQRCENYRPISILPIVSKILERSVFNQIYKFLNDNSLLSKHQSGFRPKHSTLTTLIQMCDTLYENMDNGQLSGVVFLDIRKAFDSIDHTILLQKMNDQFGIKNVELDWFKSYLTNREQACIVNGAMSSPKTIVCGVPQGSILGPLLFLLYIIITLAGIVMYFAGYNEQISGLKYILARRIWNCLLPPAIVLS